MGSTDRRPLQIAHRGGAGLWPENTMEAFARAIEAGADGIELDVHLSADNVLIVYHDEALKPAYTRDAEGRYLARPTPLLKNLTFADLQRYDVGRLDPARTYSKRYPDQQAIDGARIPALRDVIRLVQQKARKDFRLYVELKTDLLDPSLSATPEGLATAAVKLIEAMDFAQQTIFVSFDWNALRHAKKLAPHIPNAFTTLPFHTLDPASPAAKDDEPGSEEAEIRRLSAGDAPWTAGFDWHRQTGTTFADRMLGAIAAGGADGWFAWHGDVTEQTVARARQLDLMVSCWTVDNEAEMRRLAALGVDAILTDRPDRLKTVLG